MQYQRAFYEQVVLKANEFGVPNVAGALNSLNQGKKHVLEHRQLRLDDETWLVVAKCALEAEPARKGPPPAPHTATTSPVRERQRWP